MDKELDEAMKKVQECQESKGFESCFDCEIFFDCKLREEYVDIVYKSMNHGDEGGFEF
jgi:hypothetical protein